MGRLRARRRAEGGGDGPLPSGGTATRPLERKAWDLARWCERPAVLALFVALLVVAGLLVRLPHAYDEAGYFSHHPDEPTYHNKAMELLRGTAAPLAHGGSGLPIFLQGMFKLTGQEPGGFVAQGSTSELNGTTLQAVRLSYLANTLAGILVVPATFLLAAPLMRPAKALLATALVAFDPFLLFFSGHLMTEQLFTFLVVAAAACIARARSHPAWLLGAAVAMALANTVRGNGILVFGGLLLFAVLLLRASPVRRWARWVVASAAAFFVVSAPYLVWRAQYLPSAFDYGTNSRFFADHLWDFSDGYWGSYDLKEGGAKESMGDYFATHSLGDALRRLYLSVQMQVTDLFGGAAGGHRPHPEGPVLHALLSVPLVVGAIVERHRRELWAFVCVAAVTLLSLTWVYWIHDSPRYFCMLVPLAAVVAVEGVDWTGRRIGRPGTLALAFAILFLALFAVLPVLDGLAALRHANPSWGLTLAFLVLGVVAAAAGPALAAWRGRAQAGQAGGPDAP